MSEFQCDIKALVKSYKVQILKSTVNSEIFARILFLRIALKDIFAKL